MTTPIRVMIVDDAVVVRQILKDSLSHDPEIEFVGSAVDGVNAMEKIGDLKPDVVILDVEMPNMDGIETLNAIKKAHRNIRCIMFSTLTERGTRATMDAMMLGADDYVAKPSNVGGVSQSIARIQAELIPKIKALRPHSSVTTTTVTTDDAAPTPAATPTSAPEEPNEVETTAPTLAANVPLARNPFDASRFTRRAPINAAPPVARVRTGGLRTSRIDVVCIAVSTGGPNALNVLLPQLPADLNAPIVIVQHIPPVFSKALADRLNTYTAINVVEGQAGLTLQPGTAYIAPGDFHMTVCHVGSEVKTSLNQAPPENSCRPAADVLFRSVVATYGANVLGVVLTGMGYDGLAGSELVVQNGGNVIAQDENTSVVWGMPGAVVKAELADSVLPLEAIAREITNRVGTTSHAPQVLRTSH